MKENIIQRIVRLLDEKNCQDKDFCDYIGVAQSTFVNWKKRNTEPKSKYIPKIADFFGVTQEYITTGKISERESYYYDPEVQEIAEEMATRPEMKVLFKASRNLTKEQIEAINNIVNTMK